MPGSVRPDWSGVGLAVDRDPQVRGLRVVRDRLNRDPGTVGVQTVLGNRRGQYWLQALGPVRTLGPEHTPHRGGVTPVVAAVGPHRGEIVRRQDERHLRNVRRDGAGLAVHGAGRQTGEHGRDTCDGRGASAGGAIHRRGDDRAPRGGGEMVLQGVLHGGVPSRLTGGGPPIHPP